jgi:hypothetical protein
MPKQEVPKPESLPDESQVAILLQRLLIAGPIAIIVFLLLALLLPGVLK